MRGRRNSKAAEQRHRAQECALRHSHDLRQRVVEALDLVVYNPNDSIGIPKPITQFAPLTARALADRFEIEKALNPTAFVLKPRLPARRAELVAVPVAKSASRATKS